MSAAAPHGANALGAIFNGGWQPVTGETPPALEDVLVSVRYADGTRTVLQGFRVSNPEKWFVSGADAELILGKVYAWSPCPAAAPYMAEVTS